MLAAEYTEGIFSCLDYYQSISDLSVKSCSISTTSSIRQDQVHGGKLVFRSVPGSQILEARRRRRGRASRSMSSRRSTTQRTRWDRVVRRKVVPSPHHVRMNMHIAQDLRWLRGRISEP